MFAAPASQEVRRDAPVIYQVDERAAPAGDPSRNLTHLTEALGSAPASLRHRQENLLAARTQPAAGPD